MINDKLQKALDKVNQEYFSFTELPTIRLSKGQDKTDRRAIIFGTYNFKNDEIRIHPVLLEAEECALEFVIYHELLHYQDKDLLLARKKGDRVHTISFKKREKLFAQYEEASAILKKYIYPDQQVANTPKLKPSGLRGEALENALTESLQRLEHVLIKYNMTEQKGAKRGTKKKNDESQLASDV